MDASKKRCQAKTIRGTQCLKLATKGDFCGQHAKMRNVEKVGNPVLTMAMIPKMVITMKPPVQIQDKESAHRRLQETERRKLQRAEFQRHQYEETERRQRQSEEAEKILKSTQQLLKQESDLERLKKQSEERKEQERLQRLEKQFPEGHLADLMEIKEARLKKPAIKFKVPISGQKLEKIRLQRQETERRQSEMRKQLQQQQLIERRKNQPIIEKPKKVLIIEDDGYVLFSLVNYLSSIYNCDISSTTSLNGSGRFLKDEIYDLIITDTVLMEWSAITRDNEPRSVMARKNIPNINLKNSNTPLIITDLSDTSPTENNVYRAKRDSYRDEAEIIAANDVNHNKECKPVVNKYRRGERCVDYLMKRLLVDQLISENHLLSRKISK